MKQLWRDRRGLATLEYALLAGMVVLGISAGLTPGYGPLGDMIFSVQGIFIHLQNAVIDAINKPWMP